MNQALVRKNNHQKARELLSQGKLLDCEKKLCEVLDSYGPHVGVLSDLTTVYYLQNKMDLFEMALERLQQEFSQAAEKLSSKSLVNTLVMLAKFQEECCLVEKALISLNQALRVCEDLELKKKILIQKLRLLAVLGPSEELSKVYTSCLRISSCGPDTQIELLHGLMLAEHHLLGDIQAKRRFDQIWSLLTPRQAIDRRLVVGDFLEIEMNAEKKNSLLSPEQIEILKHGDAFEKTLCQIWNGDFEISQDHFESMTKMSWLRCQALCALRDQESHRIYQFKKFQLLLASMPQASKRWFAQKWPKLHQVADAIKLQFSDEKVFFQKNEILLGRKKNLKLTLEFFENRAVESLEFFVEQALGEKLNLHSFDQVRMIFSRINRDMASILGVLQPIFLISKDRVWKRSDIQIEKIKKV